MKFGGQKIHLNKNHGNIWVLSTQHTFEKQLTTNNTLNNY